MNQSVEKVVRCLVGRIEGVTAATVIGSMPGGRARLHEETEVDVAVILSAVVRRRVPARILGL